MRQAASNITRRSVLTTGAAIATTMLLGTAHASEEWKASKPIKLIVPFNAGGPTDILARLAAQMIGTSLGQPIIVENKPGASGGIGSQAVSMAAPDGTTLVLATTDSHSIYPHVQAKPLFDPRAQVAVAPLGIIPFGLLARPDFPATTLKQVVDLAKTRQITYASWGNGSAAHAATILLMRTAGIQNMLHVPFTGSAPAVQAVMASQVDVVMGPVPMVIANRSKLKPIAVMADNRVESVADMPTFAEEGMPVRREGTFWIGIFAPPKTPANIVNALSQAFAKASATPEMKGRLVQLGIVPHAATPAQYAQFHTEDYERWGRAMREAGVKQE